MSRARHILAQYKALEERRSPSGMMLAGVLAQDYTLADLEKHLCSLGVPYEVTETEHGKEVVLKRKEDLVYLRNMIIQNLGESKNPLIQIKDPDKKKCPVCGELFYKCTSHRVAEDVALPRSLLPREARQLLRELDNKLDPKSSKASGAGGFEIRDDSYTVRYKENSTVIEVDGDAGVEADIKEILAKLGIKKAA